MIYIKGLTITPMYFYETNGQVDQIKEHINPITNASQLQFLMKRNYIINQRMSNEYRSKVLLTA